MKRKTLAFFVLLLAVSFVPAFAQTPAPISGTLTDGYFYDIPQDTHLDVLTVGLMGGWPNVYFESTVTAIHKGTGDMQTKKIGFWLSNISGTNDRAEVLWDVWEIMTRKGSQSGCDAYFVPVLYNNEPYSGVVSLRITPRNCGNYIISVHTTWQKAFVLDTYDFGPVVYQH